MEASPLNIKSALTNEDNKFCLTSFVLRYEKSAVGIVLFLWARLARCGIVS